MNGSADCLTPERLRQLSAEELSPPELEHLEEHVGHCKSCRDALEQAVAEPDWQEAVRDALARDFPTQDWSALASSSAEDGRHDGARALEQFRKLLGPTDDPRMLGRIGEYEIVGILGRGGMGVVFKGFDAALNRYVAIKMLLPHLAASGAARRRFAREAQAAAAVVHDHVMAIHSVAEWQGTPYLVMPYGRGVSLQKRLREKGPLELREILRIGMQTAEGLKAAHAQGLVHRDVTPANILLAEDIERVKLTDFGLARAADDASLTRVGMLAGTPQYMSPEQARAKAVDARSDLFSLGSVLYAMCTGRAPFRADSSYGVLRLITDEEPTPIREINPDIPEWMCAIVSRLMAKRPEDRFSSASEVAELLEGCLAHIQQPMAAALPSSLLHSMGVSVLPQRKKRFTGVFTMVATLILGVATLLARQGMSPPDIAGKRTAEVDGAVARNVEEASQKSDTERLMLDFIREQAYSQVAALESLEYAFETKDDKGWHSRAELHADKERFLVRRQDVTGMWVIDKRLEPMNCSSAFDGRRQQYLDANQRLRLKTGVAGASYSITTPHQYMYMWLRGGAVGGVRAAETDDWRWDTVKNKELWQRRFEEATYVGAIPTNGRTWEIVDFPQKIEGLAPCVYRVFFDRELGFLPMKYIRRVSATTETSTTMEVSELKQIVGGSQKLMLPLELTLNESRADGVSLPQRLTITVDDESLKVNEPLDESLFIIDPALAKTNYDVDLEK